MIFFDNKKKGQTDIMVHPFLFSSNLNRLHIYLFYIVCYRLGNKFSDYTLNAVEDVETLLFHDFLTRIFAVHILKGFHNVLVDVVCKSLAGY